MYDITNKPISRGQMGDSIDNKTSPATKPGSFLGVKIEAGSQENDSTLHVPLLSEQEREVANFAQKILPGTYPKYVPPTIRKSSQQPQ